MLRFELDTPVGPVPAVVEGGGDLGILVATGAGTDQNHPGVAGLRSRLAAGGHSVMTFDYLYRAKGRSFPDRTPKLLSVHRAAAAHLRQQVGTVVLAGRSMGGRMSTMLAAEGEPCVAVVVYGYPLHPAGKPDRLRVDHMADLKVPTLIINGSNDALARSDLVDRHLRSLGSVEVQLVENADHSFRRGGTTVEEMLDMLVDRTNNWLNGLSELAVGTGSPP